MHFPIFRIRIESNWQYLNSNFTTLMDLLYTILENIYSLVNNQSFSNNKVVQRTSFEIIMDTLIYFESWMILKIIGSRCERLHKMWPPIRRFVLHQKRICPLLKSNSGSGLFSISFGWFYLFNSLLKTKFLTHFV